MMSVAKAIVNRRSVRSYERRPIPKELLCELLEMSRLAPSGKNRQPWRLIVVLEEGRKRALVPICRDQEFIADCSAFIAGLDDPKQKWARVDLAIALDHLCLAATERGLGTCWIGAFDRESMAEFLEVPSNMVVTVCMTVGYPAESPDPQRRKELEELVYWERYGGRKGG